MPNTVHALEFLNTRSLSEFFILHMRYIIYMLVSMWLQCYTLIYRKRVKDILTRELAAKYIFFINFMLRATSVFALKTLPLTKTAFLLYFLNLKIYVTNYSTSSQQKPAKTRSSKNRMQKHRSHMRGGTLSLPVARWVAWVGTSIDRTQGMKHKRQYWTT